MIHTLLITIFVYVSSIYGMKPSTNNQSPLLSSHVNNTNSDYSDSDTSDVSFSATDFENSIIALEGEIAQKEERTLTILQTFFQGISLTEAMDKVEQAMKNEKNDI